jgi:hypothetical protein
VKRANSTFILYNYDFVYFLLICFLDLVLFCHTYCISALLGGSVHCQSSDDAGFIRDVCLLHFIERFGEYPGLYTR